jgi:protein-tyrosine phosphatase
MNKQRSLTAEHLYRNDARIEVRSAGVRAEAKCRISAANLRWADIVFAMEQDHKRWITMRFEELDLPPIEVLDIPDDYEYMAADLQEMLRLTLDPEIDSLVSAREKSG